MRAAFFERKGAARDVLRIGDLPVPEMGPDDVLIRIRATAPNPSDTKMRAGTRGRVSMPWPRIIPHQDGAGVIENVGANIPRGRVGERVWLYEVQLNRPFGTAAEYAVAPARNAVPLAAGASFEEGACLGVPAMTAHRCVFADGPVEGRSVLVTGGAGAVGFYAVQFAKLGGARVIATVSREVQAAAALEAGADAVVNRRTEDVVRRVRELTAGGGVDRVIEVAFGANLPSNLQVLKPGGVVAAYSSDENPNPVTPFWDLMALDATVRFVLVYQMSREAHDEAAAAITEAMRKGVLKHRIAERFGLADIAAAHELVESGRAVGKIVIEVA